MKFLLLSLLMLVSGCASVRVPSDITDLRQMSIVNLNGEIGSTGIFDDNEVVAWIRRADKSSEAYVSWLSAETLLFQADSNVGLVYVLITHEKAAETNGEFCITVMTRKNPAIIYRYMIRKADSTLFAEWTANKLAN